MRSLSRLTAATVLFLTFAACGEGVVSGDRPPSDKGQIKLEVPENSLEGPPYSFDGKRTGSCTVMSIDGPVISNGFFRAEISQSEKSINMQLFCAPDKNSTSGYKLYTTGNLEIDENIVKGPSIQSGRIGRKGLKLVFLPINGIQYTVLALVDSKIKFEVTGLYEGREVERMTGELNPLKLPQINEINRRIR